MSSADSGVAMEASSPARRAPPSAVPHMTRAAKYLVWAAITAVVLTIEHRDH